MVDHIIVVGIKLSWLLALKIKVKKKFIKKKNPLNADSVYNLFNVYKYNKQTQNGLI